MQVTFDARSVLIELNTDGERDALIAGLDHGGNNDTRRELYQALVQSRQQPIAVATDTTPHLSRSDSIRLRRVLGVMPYTGGLPRYGQVETVSDVIAVLEELSLVLQRVAADEQDKTASLCRYDNLFAGGANLVLEFLARAAKQTEAQA